MIEKKYEFSYEIAGAAACFSRPDCGAAPISYPVPTRSALIGIAECVAYADDAYYWPERVEICQPVQYLKYVQNYNGLLRKGGGPFQLMMTVLEDVTYKVYGTVRGYGPPTMARNPMHQLRDVFEHRLRRGIFFRTPCLGLKEFVPTYFGPLRAETHADSSVDLTLPSLLDTMYDRQTRGMLSPRYLQNISVREGVLNFDQ